MNQEHKVAEPTEDLELIIEELAVGGRGLAHGPDGRVVFISGALVGEKVRCRISRARKRYLEAETIEVLEPSPRRVEPMCPIHAQCGGCDLMHLSVDAQLEAKAEWVGSALSRVGPLPGLRTLASPMDTAYRNRLRFNVRGDDLGFFAAGTNQLVPVKKCAVAAGPINRLLPGLARLARKSDASSLAGVEALTGLEDDSPVFLNLILRRGVRVTPSQAEAWRRAAGEIGIAGTRITVGARPGPYDLESDSGVVAYQGPPKMWAFPGVFCQVNFAANHRLVQEVAGATADGPVGTVLDLYSGYGNFSFPLAEAGFSVTAAEISSAADDAARFHRRRAAVKGKVELLRGDAAKTAGHLAERGRRFELVILDPPRAGARDLMPRLVELAPRRVIYVSCHPAALARDAAVLVKAGYNMTAVSVVDMFPQTSHVETVLVLDRK